MKTRKTGIILFILMCYQIGYSQSEKIKRVIFSEVEYLLYPENHGLNEWNYMPSYWRENIIRKEYKLDIKERTDGKWIQFYEGNKEIPAKIFSLSNGKVEGELKTFYSNGKIQSIRNYKQEEIVDLSLNWFENGTLRDSTIYRLDTAQNGHVFSNKIYRVVYYESGKLKQKEEYDDDGVKNGSWISYYKNGQVKLSETYSNIVDLDNSANKNSYGKRIGDYTYFYDNGQVKFQLKYKDDEIIDGEYCEYFPNGAKKQSGNLKDGLRIGKWKEWFENGKLKSIGDYQNGEYMFCGVIPYTWYYEYKIGEWKYFYKNGNLKCSGEYELSKRNIGTNCKGGADLNCGKFTNKWKAYDEIGNVSSMNILINNKLIEDKELLLDRFYKIEN